MKKRSDPISPESTEGERPGGVGPHLWRINWVRDLALIGLGVFLLWFGYYLRGIFTPLLLAIFLAYLFHPLITYIEHRWNVPRPATIAGLIVAVLLLAVGLGVWLVPVAWQELTQLIEKLPQQLVTVSQRLAERVGIDFTELTKGIDERIAEFRDALQTDPAGQGASAIKWAVAGTGHVAVVIESVAGATLYVVLMAVLIPFYFFYFAWKFGPLTRSIENYLPASNKERIEHILGRMDKTVSAYFRERVLICGIMAVMFWWGWWMCGVPYALLLGLAAGVLSLVPYVGGIVWPVAVLIAYLDRTTGADAAGFSWWAVVIWPSVVYGVVQFFEGWVLTPYIQGKSTELNPVAILVVVFIGGAIGGLYGMILCIPIAACVKILVQEVALPEMRRWAKTH